MMDGSKDQSALSINANSIKITDVTQDGDTLTFAVTSQKLSSSSGICVFRTFEDFDWLQESLFSQEDIAGLHGVIFPPLPARPLLSSSHTQAKALKQLGFLAFGDNWQLYCRALEFYLQQVAAHSILGKSKLLHSFLSSTESAGKPRSKKDIFDRLSQALEQIRKEGHKDVDEFFHNERESNTHMTALFKATTEKFLEVVLTKQRLALACGHFSTSLHLCVNQDDPSAVAFSKICLKLSDVMEAVKQNLDKVSENDVSTLGLGLDFESRYQDAKKEMLFRRTCKLVELEIIVKNAEKAKPNKKVVMDRVQKIAQKEFNLISSVAKEEIEWYHKARVTVLRDFLIHWCEKQLDTARESAAHFSQHLEAWKGLTI
ncbi:sorting nexin-6 [Clarias gariepinus]